MRQHSPIQAERRRDPRQPQAFAFWIRPVSSPNRVSAWMLDVAAGGAAFLTAIDEAPPVGERVELLEMHTTDRMVREGAAPLPPFARVVRHDDSDGITRRVAVRFEADDEEPLEDIERKTTTACAPRCRVVPSLPPLVELEPGSRLVLCRYSIDG
ncbi:MAG: PilZ domain-containing protein [Phycisphaerae bacterium]|nr:PilZ domain-containing protein [Phycisphaerae bacterium]